MLLNLLRIFFQFHRNSFTFVHQRVRFPLNFRGIDFPGRRRFWKDSVDSQKSEAGLLSSLVRVCTYNIHEHVSIENQREISNDRAGWLASTKGCHARQHSAWMFYLCASVFPNYLEHRVHNGGWRSSALGCKLGQQTPVVVFVNLPGGNRAESCR